MEQQDLINALSEPYYSKEEVEWIKNTFKGSTFGLKTLRKFFIPTLSNEAPIGSLTDMWTETADLLAKVSPQDRELLILSRIKTIQHVEKCLSTLRVIAETKTESDDERNERKRKDSVK